MITLGLTGSIGMGKSTTARMFADHDVPVWDADAVVHNLYGPGAAGSQAIAELVPSAVTHKGVDRTTLREAVISEPGLLKKIEAAIHPLVAADRARFLEEALASGASIVLFDIPLLFETGADAWLDKIVVVTAPPEIQRKRVLERPGMTETTFDAILSKQTPDHEKRARADFIIDTSKGLEQTAREVSNLLEGLNA